MSLEQIVEDSVEEVVSRFKNDVEFRNHESFIHSLYQSKANDETYYESFLPLIWDEFSKGEKTQCTKEIRIHLNKNGNLEAIGIDNLSFGNNLTLFCKRLLDVILECPFQYLILHIRFSGLIGHSNIIFVDKGMKDITLNYYEPHGLGVAPYLFNTYTKNILDQVQTGLTSELQKRRDEILTLYTDLKRTKTSEKIKEFCNTIRHFMCPEIYKTCSSISEFKDKDEIIDLLYECIHTPIHIEINHKDASCPKKGLQAYVKDKVGLCMVISFFWVYTLLYVLTNVRKIRPDIKVEKWVSLIEKKWQDIFSQTKKSDPDYLFRVVMNFTMYLLKKKKLKLPSPLVKLPSVAPSRKRKMIEPEYQPPIDKRQKTSAATSFNKSRFLEEDIPSILSYVPEYYIKGGRAFDFFFETDLEKSVDYDLVIMKRSLIILEMRLAEHLERMGMKLSRMDTPDGIVRYSIEGVNFKGDKFFMDCAPKQSILRGEYIKCNGINYIQLADYVPDLIYILKNRKARSAPESTEDIKDNYIDILKWIKNEESEDEESENENEDEESENENEDEEREDEAMLTPEEEQDYETFLLYIKDRNYKMVLKALINLLDQKSLHLKTNTYDSLREMLQGVHTLTYEEFDTDMDVIIKKYYKETYYTDYISLLKSIVHYLSVEESLLEANLKYNKTLDRAKVVAKINWSVLSDQFKACIQKQQVDNETFNLFNVSDKCKATAKLAKKSVTKVTKGCFR